MWLLVLQILWTSHIHSQEVVNTAGTWRQLILTMQTESVGRDEKTGFENLCSISKTEAAQMTG